MRYISSSTAGATLGQPTVGPLNGVAEMTVLRWDPQTRRFVDYQLVPGAAGRHGERHRPPAVACGSGRADPGRRARDDSFTRVIPVTLA